MNKFKLKKLLFIILFISFFKMEIKAAQYGQPNYDNDPQKRGTNESTKLKNNATDVTHGLKKVSVDMTRYSGNFPGSSGSDLRVDQTYNATYENIFSNSGISRLDNINMNVLIRAKEISESHNYWGRYGNKVLKWHHMEGKLYIQSIGYEIYWEVSFTRNGQPINLTDLIFGFVDADGGEYKLYNLPSDTKLYYGKASKSIYQQTPQVNSNIPEFEEMFNVFINENETDIVWQDGYHIPGYHNGVGYDDAIIGVEMSKLSSINFTAYQYWDFLSIPDFYEVQRKDIPIREIPTTTQNCRLSTDTFSYVLGTDNVRVGDTVKNMNGTNTRFNPEIIRWDSVPEVINVECDPLNYDITYILDGGINNPNNPPTYTINTPDIELKIPTKDGYIFKEWKEGNKIPTGSSGNKTFTAIWEKKVMTTILKNEIEKKLPETGYKNGYNFMFFSTFLFLIWIIFIKKIYRK